MPRPWNTCQSKLQPPRGTCIRREATCAAGGRAGGAVLLSHWGQGDSTMRSIWLDSCPVPKLFILLLCVVLPWLLFYCTVCVCLCVRDGDGGASATNMHTDVSVQLCGTGLLLPSWHRVQGSNSRAHFLSFFFFLFRMSFLKYKLKVLEIVLSFRRW